MVLQLPLDPDSSVGNALVISNNSTQTSGNLVEIDGTSGQMALNVKTGDTILGGVLEVTGQTDNNNTGIINTWSYFKYIIIRHCK